MLFFLNGPPSSGKDTIGAALRDRLNAQHGDGAAQKFKFATTLKRATLALYYALHGTLRRDLDAVEDPAEWEKDKDVASALMFGESKRSAYIAVSERLLKQLHGEEFFGHLLAHELQRAKPRFGIVTDSGFLPELRAVLRDRPREVAYVVRIGRPGCSYLNDSRGYLPTGGCYEVGARCIQVMNAGTAKSLAEIVDLLSGLPEY